jgi:hypothetical protein
MPPENSEQNFSADDLASLGETPADDGGGGDGKAATETAKAATEGQKGASEGAKAATEATEAATAAKGKDGKTIATGADAEVDDAAKDKAAADAKAEKLDRNELTEDLRKAIAEHYAAGDKKAEAKELRRLERVKDIKSLWGMYRELESRFDGGGLIKKPGKDAKPEEIADYHKALGVPEKPEDYFKEIKLDNGAVIGEADKPLVDGFAAAVHKSGATPQFVNAALNWYYDNQMEQAAALDEADDSFRRENERALRDELGPAKFKNIPNHVALLFKTAPGGMDLENPNALMTRLLGGRTADGRIIGNDADITRWLVDAARELYPRQTAVGDGNQSGMGMDDEIAQIEGRMKNDRQAYYKDEKAQARYRELIDIRSKIRARA